MHMHDVTAFTNSFFASFKKTCFVFKSSHFELRSAPKKAIRWLELAEFILSPWHF